MYLFCTKTTSLRKIVTDFPEQMNMCFHDRGHNESDEAFIEHYNLHVK